MINNVKIKTRSLKEVVHVLEILFSKGHTWRGGSTNTDMSRYEADNLIGLYISDDTFYSNDKAVVTFETDCQGFWSDKNHLSMTPEQVEEYYQ